MKHTKRYTNMYIVCEYNINEMTTEYNEYIIIIVKRDK